MLWAGIFNLNSASKTKSVLETNDVILTPFDMSTILMHTAFCAQGAVLN